MKSCFLICPIGDDGSATRKHSDQLLEHVIKPVLNETYEITRADQMPKPGVITTQIVEEIFQSDIVIADLSGHNPNVFYELALRHAFRKSFIQLIKFDEKIPFDLSSVRTIKFNLSDPDDIVNSRLVLRAQLNELESGYVPDSPVSVTSAIILFKENPNANANAQNLEKFWEVEDRFDRLEDSLGGLHETLDLMSGDVSNIEREISDITSKLEE